MNGKVNLSTVACDRWADWSLTPLPETYGNAAAGPEAVTIEMERYVIDGEAADTLAIYVVQKLKNEEAEPVERRQLVREVTWVFEPALVEKDSECWVGVMAAKPTRDEDEPERALEVTFEDLEIEMVA